MVVGTEEDFMEMQMSSNPYFSSKATWPRALSTRASGVGPPYFSNRGFSREPPLTPMRMGMPRSLQALATASTRSSEPMLPGLMRILSMPPSTAVRASR